MEAGVLGRVCKSVSVEVHLRMLSNVMSQVGIEG